MDNILFDLGLSAIFTVLRSKAKKQLAKAKPAMLKVFKYTGEAYKDDADFKAAAAKIAGCEETES